MPLTTNIIEKQPGEKLLLNMDFGPRLDTNEQILSVVSVTGYPDDLVFENIAFSSSVVQFLVSGGSILLKGYQDYKVTIVIQTNYSQIIEEEGCLRIVET